MEMGMWYPIRDRVQLRVLPMMQEIMVVVVEFQG